MHDALDGMIAYLMTEGELEYALQQIESQKSVVIPRLKAWDTANIKSRAYPLMELWPDTTDINYRDDEGPLDHEGMDVHNVVAQLAFMESDLKAGEYALLYYRKAFARIVREDSSFGARFNRVRMGQTQYWPMLQNQKAGKIMQVLTQRFIVRKLQD